MENVIVDSVCVGKIIKARRAKMKLERRVALVPMEKSVVETDFVSRDSVTVNSLSMEKPVRNLMRNLFWQSTAEKEVQMKSVPIVALVYEEAAIVIKPDI